MRQDKQENYGEEAREVIAGLRHLARDVEPPANLLSKVLERVEPLLPPKRGIFAWWRQGRTAWPPPPLVWGPALALACFVAGVWVTPPQFGPSAQRPISELPVGGSEESMPPSATPMPVPTTEESTTLPSVGHVQPGQRAAVSKQLGPAAPEPAPEATSRPRLRAQSPPQVQVTTTLPTALYEQLLREARRRQAPLSTILQEAVQAYVQGRSRGVRDP